MTKIQEEIVAILSATQLDLKIICNLVINRMMHFNAIADKKESIIQQELCMLRKLYSFIHTILTRMYTSLQEAVERYKQIYSCISQYNTYLRDWNNLTLMKARNLAMHDPVDRNYPIIQADANWPDKMRFDRNNLDFNLKRIRKGGLTARQRKVMAVLIMLETVRKTVHNQVKIEIAQFNENFVKHHNREKALQRANQLSNLLSFFSQKVLTESLPILKESFSKYCASIHRANRLQNLVNASSLRKPCPMLQLAATIDHSMQDTLAHTTSIVENSQKKQRTLLPLLKTK
jgi:hypothetical protein